MKLIRFTATKVHGYLDFDINFKEDVTFLIGINGTGKTSVLKLILGLISPSYKYLNQIEFETAELIIGDFLDTPSTLIKARTTNAEEIDVSLQNNETSLSGNIKKSEIKIFDSEFSSEEVMEKMKTFQHYFESQDIYKEIKKITTPLFLGLDRRIYEGGKIDKMSRYRHYFRRRSANIAQNDPLNVSLIDLQEVIFDYYRVMGARQAKYNEEFKNKILAQSFDFVEDYPINLKADYRELLQKKAQILLAIEKLSVSYLTDKINMFFDKMVTLLRGIESNIIETDGQIRFSNKDKSDKQNFITLQNWFTNQPQLKRIDEIVNFSLQYQKQSEKLSEPVERLKKLIDMFFKESKKELLIDAEGELGIKFLSANKTASCYELSSGEKQILTMIGHLIFFEESFQKESGIFIIDEPELSLHLAWQEIFVSCLIEASPSTQFILATHSPAIVADYKEENCEDLAKLN